MRFWISLLGAIALASNAVAQDKNGPAKIVVLTEMQAVQLLIANDRLDDVKQLLERERAANPDDSQTLFLLATIAVTQKDYDTAISLFRRILVREPEAERVRLELARTFFLKGDYDNADHQFRFARAGNIDDAVKANIDHFLAAINRLREWTVNFSVALAPDQCFRPTLCAGSQCTPPERHRHGGRYRRGMVATVIRQHEGAHRRRCLSRGI
jgi:tetratricopeptide (TPR) repeat protein